MTDDELRDLLMKAAQIGWNVAFEKMQPTVTQAQEQLRDLHEAIKKAEEASKKSWF